MVFYIVGLVVIVLGLVNLLKAMLRRSWPETIGRIDRNEVAEISSHTNYWFNSGLISKRTARPIEDSGKSKELWLSYVYAVDGYKYIGNQLYSAPIKNPKNRIFGLIEGDKVKVFYHPKKPHIAFLAHSFARPSLVVSLMGLLIILITYLSSAYA